LFAVRRARGFTVMEILVAIGIGAVLLAVILPTLQGSIEQSRITKMATDLTAISEALRAYEKHVGTYPLDLSQLNTRPVAGTDKNSCGVVLTAEEVALWRGPYLPTPPPYFEGEDTIFGNLKRKAASTKNPDILQVSIRQPPTSTALALDSIFDGDQVLTAGTITWTNNTFPNQVLFSIPIPGC